MRCRFCPRELDFGPLGPAVGEPRVCAECRYELFRTPPVRRVPDEEDS